MGDNTDNPNRDKDFHCPTITKDYVALSVVKHNFYETEETVTVQIYVPQVPKKSLQVECSPSTLSLKFQSSDEKFLKLHDANNTTVFQWELKLEGSITPSEYSPKVTSKSVEITLHKQLKRKWSRLEAIETQSQCPRTAMSAVLQDIANRGPQIPDHSDNIADYVSTKPTCRVSPYDPADDNVPVSGFIGLHNLGNTCFMNSVLQVLANTAELRDYCCSGGLEINHDNPLGMGGRLAIQFALLVKKLWKASDWALTPKEIKSLVSKKSGQFSGYYQHDAHEFMSSLLDGLHEDLNRILSKPYVVDPDDDSHKPDEVAGAEAWTRYKMRNDSIIVDLFQGQFKSTVICPTCHKVSITFDPYMYVSVPLPINKLLYKVTFLPRDHTEAAKSVSVRLTSDSPVEALIQNLALNLHMDPDQLRLLEVRDSKLQRHLPPMQSLNLVAASSKLIACEIIPERLNNNEKVVEFIVSQRVSIPPESLVSHCAHCHVHPPLNSKLLRCTGCYRFGYCNKKCQSEHWSSAHKFGCRYRPHLVGTPYIVSLSANRMTVSTLRNLIYLSALRSVDVFRWPVKESSHIASDSNEADTPPVENFQSFHIKATELSGDMLTTEDKDVLSSIELLNKETLTSGESTKVLHLSGVTYLALEWLNGAKVRCPVTVDTKPIKLLSMADPKEANEPDELTLSSCLQSFIEAEVLSQSEAWYCPRCKEHKQATKQINLYRLPCYLIVQLKRFSVRQGMFMAYRDKLDRLVKFPHSIDVSPYCAESCVSLESGKAWYDLYGVVNHYGSMAGGHYTSYARYPHPTDSQASEQPWRLFDDSRVTSVPEAKIVTGAAYILFYRRRGKLLTLIPAPRQSQGAVDLSKKESKVKDVKKEVGICSENMTPGQVDSPTICKYLEQSNQLTTSACSKSAKQVTCTSIPEDAEKRVELEGGNIAHYTDMNDLD